MPRPERGALQDASTAVEAVLEDPCAESRAFVKECLFSAELTMFRPPKPLDFDLEPASFRFDAGYTNEKPPPQRLRGRGGKTDATTRSVGSSDGAAGSSAGSSSTSSIFSSSSCGTIGGEDVSKSGGGVGDLGGLSLTGMGCLLKPAFLRLRKNCWICTALASHRSRKKMQRSQQQVQGAPSLGGQ